MLIIPVLGRLRQEAHRFVMNLSYLVRPCFKIKNRRIRLGVLLGGRKLLGSIPSITNTHTHTQIFI